MFERYLEVQNWNMDKATKMFEETLAWRSTYKFEEIHWVWFYLEYTNTFMSQKKQVSFNDARSNFIAACWMYSLRQTITAPEVMILLMRVGLKLLLCPLGSSIVPIISCFLWELFYLYIRSLKRLRRITYMINKRCFYTRQVKMVHASGGVGWKTATILASQMGQYGDHCGGSSRLNTSWNICRGVGHTSMNCLSVVNASGQRVNHMATGGAQNSGVSNADSAY